MSTKKTALFAGPQGDCVVCGRDASWECKCVPETPEEVANARRYMLPVEVKRTFRGTERSVMLPVNDALLAQWQGGMLIQDAFPHLTPDEREYIMTGMLPFECAMFFNEEA
jgi:hypothetical protein